MGGGSRTTGPDDRSTTMVIGAYKDDDKGSDSGSAYVFTRATTPGATSPSQLDAGYQAERTRPALVADMAPGGVDDDDDGDRGVLGRRRWIRSGSAYVFTRDTAGDPPPAAAGCQADRGRRRCG